LRRNPFIGKTHSNKRKTLEKCNPFKNLFFEYQTLDNSLCTRTSAGWMPSEGEGIQKQA
jgi:hypothetical protein